ncbi:MAG: hypothetical protein IJL91_05725 [Bacteroidales bacterium]|nr:hypothetical protein [Bacteroidales bacterium]
MNTDKQTLKKIFITIVTIATIFCVIVTAAASLNSDASTYDKILSMLSLAGSIGMAWIIFSKL